MDDIRAIGDQQGLLHVVIGDQNPNVPLFELSDAGLFTRVRRSQSTSKL